MADDELGDGLPVHCNADRDHRHGSGGGQRSQQPRPAAGMRHHDGRGRPFAGLPLVAPFLGFEVLGPARPVVCVQPIVGRDRRPQTVGEAGRVLGRRAVYVQPLLHVGHCCSPPSASSESSCISCLRPRATLLATVPVGTSRTRAARHRCSRRGAPGAPPRSARAAVTGAPGGAGRATPASPPWRYRVAGSPRRRRQVSSKRRCRRRASRQVVRAIR